MGVSQLLCSILREWIKGVPSLCLVLYSLRFGAGVLYRVESPVSHRIGLSMNRHAVVSGYRNLHAAASRLLVLHALLD